MSTTTDQDQQPKVMPPGSAPDNGSALDNGADADSVHMNGTDATEGDVATTENNVSTEESKNIVHNHIVHNHNARNGTHDYGSGPSPAHPEGKPGGKSAPGSVDREQNIPPEDSSGQSGAVQIRGSARGVAIEFSQEEKWDELLKILADRLGNAKGFFRGGRVVLSVGSRPLDEKELKDVCIILEQHEMKLGVVRSRSDRTVQAALALGVSSSTDDLQNDGVQSNRVQNDRVQNDDTQGDRTQRDSVQRDSVRNDAQKAVPERPADTFPFRRSRVDRGKTERSQAGHSNTGHNNTERAKPERRKIERSRAERGKTAPSQPNYFVHRGHLRSGQILRKSESVVVLGDVNPGAQVISTGDVMVWGRLRGIVHAGVDGNRRAAVAALELSPTQLRIANVAAHVPERKNTSRGFWLWKKEAEPHPEVAQIEKDRIIVKPWEDAKPSRLAAFRR